ncbi:DUF5605 domain-containing protein [Paenibacillus lemnae]|uniref:DUF5060 domain-containing protein n=1 Tax=Paenibacillus lemnae TaxID=1330551 RepID=A0A848MD25_PAELE|nr:DUF5060 domain-containing protein [Paenibacillus lemnae]NMO98040.1 DUF5060 domain-containing protein [Paenibacillus lemnae]
MNNHSVKNSVECWDCFELRLKGPNSGNPYVDITWNVTFHHESREVKVMGFYAGREEYAARFMPDEIGEWTYETSSDCIELNGVTGSFTCTASSSGNHGPVRVTHDERFAYADSTPYHPFGTTAYAWIHQPEELYTATLQTLKNNVFNKIRMCLLPKNYSFNAQEPELYPFEGAPQEGFDTSRFNPAFWDHLDRCIEALLKLGIEADIILFHPYDKGRWGFDVMGSKADDLYLRYAIARLSAYRNIWWAMANEYDFMKEMTMSDWDRLISIASNEDPHQHLLSIHNGTGMYEPGSIFMYDHTRPEITHCSIQHWDVTLVTEWRKQYGKPVIVDECGYEGNLPQRWGNLSAGEMTHRVWESFARGGYTTHGETYLHPQDEIWWAKGGALFGCSKDQIGFLRDIVDKAPNGLRPFSIPRDAPMMGIENEYYLYYYGQHQPGYREFELREDKEFIVDWIDTHKMTITTLETTYQGTCRIPLPGRPYFALRIRCKEE